MTLVTAGWRISELSKRRIGGCSTAIMRCALRHRRRGVASRRARGVASRLGRRMAYGDSARQVRWRRTAPLARSGAVRRRTTFVRTSACVCRGMAGTLNWRSTLACWAASATSASDRMTSAISAWRSNWFQRQRRAASETIIEISAVKAWRRLVVGGRQAKNLGVALVLNKAMKEYRRGASW